MDILKIRETVRNKYKIGFDAKMHRYTFGGQILPSVTTLLNLLDKPFDTDGLALKCSQNPEHKLFGWTVEGIIKEWQRVSDEACDRGSALHEYIEAYLLNDFDRLFIANANPNLNQTLVKKFHQFYNEKLVANDFEIVDLECKIVSPSLGICGTFDSLFYFPKQNGLYVFDWKTNGKFDEHSDFSFIHPYQHLDKSKWTTYTLQLHIYKYILQVDYGLDIKGQRIIWLNEEKGVWSYKPKFDYNPKFIESMVGVLKERSNLIDKI
jgi:hypothetical protein